MVALPGVSPDLTPTLTLTLTHDSPSAPNRALQVAEVLGAVADGILPLGEQAAEEVLGDALRLLGSKEIKVGCWVHARVGVCLGACRRVQKRHVVSLGPGLPPPPPLQAPCTPHDGGW